MSTTEQLLDSIDRGWVDEQPRDLAPLLDSLAPDDWGSALELCAADLEWRWRGNRTTGQDPIHGLPVCPNAVDYMRLLHKHWQEISVRRGLCVAEWGARSLWGDAPDLDEFASQDPERSVWRSDLEVHLQTLDPIHGKLITPVFEQAHTVQLSPDFCIGRQSLDEPHSPAWIADSNRLVIKDIHYRIISRRQLRVQRTSARVIELSNVSDSIGGSWAGQTLNPGDQAQLMLPVQIKIDSTELRIFSRLTDQDG